MDKLERRLRDDAAMIRADVSAELDERIRASLEAAAAMRGAGQRPRRDHRLWFWASTLTGLAAALALVVVLNPRQQPADTVPPPEILVSVPPAPVTMPALNARTAVLTAPLEEELDDLEADIEKARDVVRKDLGLEF
jgi:anti-sigma-K factor RskA